jgi:pimeloyl-ACP methyl ester carboxylesterase
MDPRGINNSGPNLDCFEDNPAARDYYDQHYYMYDPTSNFSMAEHFEASGGFGDWCSQSLTREANYANTPATARDMLQYIEKLAESRGEDSKEAKLNYYGISYGSALGTTYATLFPDRVGHMIIDGVVDVTDYYGGSWTQNLLLADEAVKSFFQYCFNAGPLCNFFKNDTSPEAIGKRFNAVLDDIDTSPVPVTDKAVVDFPTVITSVDVRYFLLMAIYDSVTIFPIFASVLADLELRNGSSMIDLLKMVSLPKGLMPKASCDWEGPSYCDIQPKLLVACNDQDGRYNISTLEKWHEYVTELKGISNYVGEVWAAVITLQCRSLQFSPPETQKFYGKLYSHSGLTFDGAEFNQRIIVVLCWSLLTLLPFTKTAYANLLRRLQFNNNE